MRSIIAALLLTTLAAAQSTSPALAQQKVFTPAPVPRLGPHTVAPADRVGRPNGAERAAPFSGLPDTMNASNGQPTPANGGALGRNTAPAPSLSK